MRALRPLNRSSPLIHPIKPGNPLNRKHVICSTPSPLPRETGEVRLETWVRKCETGDARLETWDRKCETGEVRLEKWDRKCETGEVRQET